MTKPAKQELRDLIRAKLTDHMMTLEQATDAVMTLFYDAADEWESIEVTTMGELPARRYLDQRWLVARVPRESVDRVQQAPNREVTP